MLKNKARTAILAGGVMAVLAPAAALGAGENRPVDGGARNPAADSRQNYTRETEIIANVGTYGTRQSNKSDNGGGAIYGCRSKPGGSPARNEPCVRSVNLADGLSFEFSSQGVLGGTIVVGRGGDGTRPFTTNATGVATGLNADRVDGRSGDQLLGKTEKAADADKLDGRESADFAAAGDMLFATVSASGAVTRSRGGEATASVAGSTFTVTFPKDVSACSLTATQNSGTATAGLTISATSAGGRDVTVDQAGGGPVPFHLQVIC